MYALVDGLINGFGMANEISSAQVWEPPTKQFYPECQPSSDLQSSQSVRSIAAPISIG
jgi:hypothetical protein